jgi:opacity protein-like surface antigen
VTRDHNWFWICRRAMAIAVGLTMLVAILSAATAPSVTGDWQGTATWFSAENGNRQLQVLVHISQASDGKFAGTLGFPDMGTDTVPLSAITFKEPALHFEFELGAGSGKNGGKGNNAGAASKYDGAMSKDNSTITGNVVSPQGKMALVLKRVK